MVARKAKKKASSSMKAMKRIDMKYDKLEKKMGKKC